MTKLHYSYESQLLTIVDDLFRLALQGMFWRIFYMNPESDLWAIADQSEQNFGVHFPYYRRLARKLS